MEYLIKYKNQILVTILFAIYMILVKPWYVYNENLDERINRFNGDYWVLTPYKYDLNEDVKKGYTYNIYGKYKYYRWIKAADKPHSAHD